MWFIHDVTYQRNGFIIKDIGAFLPWHWLSFYFIESARYFLNHFLLRHPTYNIHCFPKPPQPWYLWCFVWRRAGARLIHPENDHDNDCDIAIAFLDQTYTNPKNKKPKNCSIHLNFDCTDISKSKVQTTFQKVFGYDLGIIDPLSFQGPMVMKSERNGAHDGQIIQGPIAKRKVGWVYQHVIDNSMTRRNHEERRLVLDIRSVVIDGEVVLIFLKERSIRQRFDNCNTRCCLITNPRDVFNQRELDDICLFCREMKLDFGGLDILRDNASGKIYIVDANKTDMGPPLQLSFLEKCKAIGILAKAFSESIRYKDR